MEEAGGREAAAVAAVAAVAVGEGVGGVGRGREGWGGPALCGGRGALLLWWWVTDGAERGVVEGGERRGRVRGCGSEAGAVGMVVVVAATGGRVRQG